jgi:predicted nucleic acid-binding protein
MKLLDTCFLIDLQREFRSKKRGASRVYLEEHRSDHFGISVISLSEFLEGFDDPADGEGLLRPFQLLGVNPAVARQASRIRRGLRLKGQLIGDFDILIAATAVVGEFTLVTKNTDHFGRIDGLLLEAY